jgi:hypothetical protein
MAFRSLLLTFRPATIFLLVEAAPEGVDAIKEPRHVRLLPVPRRERDRFASSGRPAGRVDDIKSLRCKTTARILHGLEYQDKNSIGQRHPRDVE